MPNARKESDTHLHRRPKVAKGKERGTAVVLRKLGILEGDYVYTGSEMVPPQFEGFVLSSEYACNVQGCDFSGDSTQAKAHMLGEYGRWHKINPSHPLQRGTQMVYRYQIDVNRYNNHLAEQPKVRLIRRRDEK